MSTVSSPSRINVSPYQQLSSINEPIDDTIDLIKTQPLKQSQWTIQRILTLSLVITIYMCSGIGLTLLNKYFLSPQYYNFNYPIGLICVHMLSNSILSYIYIQIFLQKYIYLSHPLYYTNISFKQYSTQFIPLGCLFVDSVVLVIYFHYHVF